MQTCVAFVSNKAMIPGLCAAVASLARALGDQARNIPVYVFESDLSENFKTRLRLAIGHINRDIDIVFRKINTEPYAELLPLQGDLMAYVRLGLPRILPEYERILYLDADMIFGEDIKSVLHTDISQVTFAASGVGSVLHSLEKGFFHEVLGYDKNAKTFNSGLLLINTRRWLEEDVEQKAIAFGKTHRAYCQSADQTILNGLYINAFLPLPPTFNSRFGPWGKSSGTCAVTHFVGMPKPWDLAGSLIHRGYAMWKKAAIEGGYSGLGLKFAQLPHNLSRAWVGRRSLARAVRNRFIHP